MEDAVEGGGCWVVGKEVLGNFCQSCAILEGVGEVGEILLEGDIDFFVIEFRHTKRSTFIAGNEFFTISDDGFAVFRFVNEF